MMCTNNYRTSTDVDPEIFKQWAQVDQKSNNKWKRKSNQNQEAKQMQILQEISTLGSYWTDFGCHFESQWADLGPGWIKNQIKSMPQIDAKISRLLEGPGGARKAPSYTLFAPLGGTWSIFGAILAPIGFRRGSPNRQFLIQIRKQWEKGGPRNDTPKTWFL